MQQSEQFPAPVHIPVRIPQRVLLTREGSPTSYAPARNIAILADEEDDGRPKKNSGRSTCLYLDPNDGFWKLAEGQLEMNTGLRLIAGRNVVRIEPQFGPTKYTEPDGRRTHTVWDFRAHLVDASKSVIAAKPAAKAAKHNTDALSRFIFEQMPHEDADRVQTVTERDLPAWALANYRLLHSVRNDRNRPFEVEMRAATGKLLGAMTLEEFCRRWGGMGSVGRTAAYLIFEGALAMTEPATEIGSATIVTRREGGQSHAMH